MFTSVFEYSFPLFKYAPEDLSAFTFSNAIGIFLLLLKTGETTAFEPQDTNAFYKWLKHWQVREVTTY